jgi:hypothetical protein
MDVRIGTLTSRVTVTDGGGASPELVETIVAVVLQRLRDDQASRENTNREQEVRPHMVESRR